MNHDVKVARQSHLPLRSRFWAGYFLLTIALVGLPLAYGICIPFYVLSLINPKAREPADFVLRWGIGWLMRLQPWLEGEFEIEVPSGGVLLVCNHRSHLDAFLLLSRIRGLRMLAKNSLFRIPFLGTMMRASGQIPVQQGHLDSFWQAMKTVRSKLSDGETVLVFPEMTRCHPGFAGSGNFVTAPFQAAKEANVPVVPIVIEGTDAVWPRGAFALRPKQSVRVRALTTLEPGHFSSAEELCREAKRCIDEALA